jgi:photosystem II stability/assembly factor-like uncharacterized protein
MTLISAYGQNSMEISIELLYEDSLLNVRALEVHNGEIYFATANSEIFHMSSITSEVELLAPPDKINEPNFRSLAVTNEGIFALGIGSPALLYRNGKVVYHEDHDDAFYDAMTFWNDQEGIAMGDQIGDCISIIITRDGGKTWSKLSCDQLPNSPGSEGAFASSDTNIKTLGNHTWIATGGTSSRIFYSPDKGETWEVFETPIIKEKATSGMYSVDFYDEHIGFAIGGDYTDPDANFANKVKTIDGGKTWMKMADGQNPGYRSCVQFVPNGKGEKLVAIGFKGIDYSADGGSTWNHLSDEGFYTIRFIDEKTAIVAGNGRVSKIEFNAK